MINHKVRIAVLQGLKHVKSRGDSFVASKNLASYYVCETRQDLDAEDWAIYHFAKYISALNRARMLPEKPAIIHYRRQWPVTALREGIVRLFIIDACKTDPEGWWNLERIVDFLLKMPVTCGSNHDPFVYADNIDLIETQLTAWLDEYAGPPYPPDPSWQGRHLLGVAHYDPNASKKFPYDPPFPVK